MVSGHQSFPFFIFPVSILDLHFCLIWSFMKTYYSLKNNQYLWVLLLFSFACPLLVSSLVLHSALSCSGGSWMMTGVYTSVFPTRFFTLKERSHSSLTKLSPIPVPSIWNKLRLFEMKLNSWAMDFFANNLCCFTPT